MDNTGTPWGTGTVPIVPKSIQLNQFNFSPCAIIVMKETTI